MLGTLAHFHEDERVRHDAMPELERLMLHRLAELDLTVRKAYAEFDYKRIFAALSAFMTSDLSAFYFDIRKDAVYCDRPDSLRRRAARTVLDQLHRCLTAWLAPVLCFTAEEAWCARFGEDDSVHLQLFPELPQEWRDAALAARWETIRAIRRRITVPIEEARRANTLGSSLQAAVMLPLKPEQELLLTEEEWAEVAIVSGVTITPDPEERAATINPARGDKCARCWRVLSEVGAQPGHPMLCARCTDAVESGLVCRV